MISKKTVNAIELCVLLAGQRAEGYMTTTDLSPRLGLSISHLENILKPLKDEGIVLSMKGPGGGYMIRGDVSLISIWDVACVFEKTLVDLDKSGAINAGKNTVADHGDMVILGNQLPQYLYGINASASWKGLELAVFFQGVGKQDLYITEILNGNVFRGPANGPLHMMVYEQHLDYWRDASSPLGANPNAYYAKPYSVFDGDNSKNYGRPVDRYLPSGAYCRLKNLRLGYTIPSKITNRAQIKGANIYFSGENLFIINNCKPCEHLITLWHSKQHIRIINFLMRYILIRKF
jgi:Rrf2 family protein